MSGKGSKRRPARIEPSEYETHFERTFGRVSASPEPEPPEESQNGPEKKQAPKR